MLEPETYFPATHQLKACQSPDSKPAGALKLLTRGLCQPPKKDRMKPALRGPAARRTSSFMFITASGFKAWGLEQSKPLRKLLMFE